MPNTKIHYLRNATTGKELCRLKGSRRFAFLPGGNSLVLEPDAGIVGIWDIDQSRELWSFPLAGDHDNYLARDHFTLSPDGRILAVPGKNNAVQLWELATGQVRRELPGHQGLITALAFFPDGRRLISASMDTTGLIWDVKRPGKSAGDVETLWKCLADRDAAKAYDAVLDLTEMPDKTIPFLRKHLRAATFVPMGRVSNWIADLGSERFAVRSRANYQLSQLGRMVEPHLKKALTDPQLSLEVHLRIEKLLDELRTPVSYPEQLLGLRSVEVLEHIGTPEAREILGTLARGAPGVRLTVEAQAAVQRLTKENKGARRNESPD